MSEYDKYRDSGVFWLGKIPEHWELKRTKAILAERNEKNDPLKTSFILSLGASYGVVPYSEKEGGGNKAKEDVTAYKLAYPGDIVMNSMNIISGSVGLSNYYGCVSPVYYMLYPRNNNISVEYYNLLFQTNAFQRSLIGLGNGIMMKESQNGSFNTVRMRIPIAKINVLLLPVPPIEEQLAICNYLNREIRKIDKIIAEARSSIEEYKAWKASFIYETVTKGLDSNVEMKDSGIDYIGDIPSTWVTKKLRNIGTTQNGISKSAEFFGEGYPFVSYGDVYKNYSLPEIPSGLVLSTDDERSHYSVEEGDIFFTRTSETIDEIGFSCVCEKTIPNATFAGFLIRVRPYTDDLLTGFSKYYFRSVHHRAFFVKEMNLVTRASLSQGLLKSMPVLIPPKDEQKRIAEYLDKKCSVVDALIQEKQGLITDLEAFKKSLIFEVVTGKRWVME